MENPWYKYTLYHAENPPETDWKQKLSFYKDARKVITLAIRSSVYVRFSLYFLPELLYVNKIDDHILRYKLNEHFQAQYWYHSYLNHFQSPTHYCSWARKLLSECYWRENFWTNICNRLRKVTLTSNSYALALSSWFYNESWSYSVSALLWTL